MTNIIEKEVRVKFTDEKLEHGFVARLNYTCGPDVEDFFNGSGEIFAVGATKEEAYLNLNSKYDKIKEMAEKSGYRLKSVLVEDLTPFGNALKLNLN
jgi:hypothetical protein